MKNDHTLRSAVREMHFEADQEQREIDREQREREIAEAGAAHDRLLEEDARQREEDEAERAMADEADFAPYEPVMTPEQRRKFMSDDLMDACIQDEDRYHERTMSDWDAPSEEPSGAFFGRFG